MFSDVLAMHSTYPMIRQRVMTSGVEGMFYRWVGRGLCFYLTFLASDQGCPAGGARSPKLPEVHEQSPGIH